MTSDLCFSKLSPDFDRKSFDCGVPELNDFLGKRARKHMTQKMSVTYVLHKKDEAEILGYYTISMAEIRTIDLQEELIRGLPHHPVPAVRLGRLAVSKSHREKGYGSVLLWDAIEKAISLSEEIGVRAVEAHAKDDPARAFYRKHGFISLADDTNHLYLSIDTARRALERLEESPSISD
ncbi:MAG: GNAT family N-acetyltransferase [Bacteroidetes bacterium]|nr:GNAT family N-acetyltransferase [Bacteroidota bacterium]